MLNIKVIYLLVCKEVFMIVEVDCCLVNSIEVLNFSIGFYFGIVEGIRFCYLLNLVKLIC